MPKNEPLDFSVISADLGFTDTPAEVAPPYKLFRPLHIALASFLGTPLTGAGLFAYNQIKLQKPNYATISISCGIIITAIIAVIAAVMYTSRMQLTMNLLFGSFIMAPTMLLIARAYLKRALIAHEQKGGQLFSTKTAAIAGLSSAAAITTVYMVISLIVVPVVTGIFESNELGERVRFGDNSDVYYTSGVTNNEAQALGTYLEDMGYGIYGGATVQLQKLDDTYILSCVVQKNSWNDEDTVSGLRDLGVSIAEELLPGRRIEVHICDSLMVVHKKIDDIPVSALASNEGTPTPDMETAVTTAPTETPEPVETATPDPALEPTPTTDIVVENTPTPAQDPTEEPTSTETPMPDFFIHDLEIKPSLARLSDTVIFGVQVTNLSDNANYYTINLRIDGQVFTSRNGLLQAGQSQRFRLTKPDLTVGKHAVQVYGYDSDGYQMNRQESSFTVIHD